MIAASPDADACRNAPGGGVMLMPESDVVGGRRTATGSGSSLPCAQATRGSRWVRANSVSAMRSASSNIASVRSSTSGPLSSRFAMIEPSRRTAPSRATRTRNGAISATSAGFRTRHSVRSTTSALCSRCRPRLILPPALSAARSIRRALAWGGARRRCHGGIGGSRAAQGGAQLLRLPRDVGVIGASAAARSRHRRRNAGRVGSCVHGPDQEVSSASAAEGRQASLGAAEDQRMNVVRALVGVDRLQVHYMADDVVLVGPRRCRRACPALRARSPAPCRSCCASAG